MSLDPLSQDTLERLAAVIESRLPGKGGDPAKSYVARLLHLGPDAFLKKIGEEATEVVMACKDLTYALDAGVEVERRRAGLVAEFADLWFHGLVAMAHYGLKPSDVLMELQRREGLGGIEEKALRKAIARERSEDETS